VVSAGRWTMRRRWRKFKGLSIRTSRISDGIWQFSLRRWGEELCSHLQGDWRWLPGYSESVSFWPEILRKANLYYSGKVS